LSLKLADVLQVQEGFEAMMRFLVKEFSCENLLCYVELSQYVATWQPPINPSTINQRSVEYDEDTNTVTTFNEEISDNITTSMHIQMQGQSPTNKHYKTSSMHDAMAMARLDDAHSSEQLQSAQFAYFENPEFEDELAHYEYIMQKYIYDSACLQINISGGLRHEAQTVSPGMDSVRIIQLINDIRAELWSLMRDSFTRFRATKDYKKMAEVLRTKKELENKQNAQSPRNHHH